MKIGDVAREVGVSVETMRYYEQEGLISEPDRNANGYRRYDRGAVDQVGFIKRAQDVGFTLKDIKELLSLRADPDASCCDVRERAESKVREMQNKIDTLTRMKRVLSDWIDECRGAGPVS